MVDANPKLVVTQKVCRIPKNGEKNNETYTLEQTMCPSFPSIVNFIQLHSCAVKIVRRKIR